MRLALIRRRENVAVVAVCHVRRRDNVAVNDGLQHDNAHHDGPTREAVTNSGVEPRVSYAVIHVVHAAASASK